MRCIDAAKVGGVGRKARASVWTTVVSCLALAAMVAVPIAMPKTATAAEEPQRESSLGDYKVKDRSKVYYGNARMFKKPAVIDCDRVYRQIPEYKKILEKGLTDRDAKYHLLMKKASQRFAEAVKQMARDMDHDLVACSSAIEKAREGAKDLPDRTDEVIRNIN